MMKKLTQLLSLTVLGLTISACSSNGDEHAKICANNQGEFNACPKIEFPEVVQDEKRDPKFVPAVHFHELNDFTEQLVGKLQYQLAGNDPEKLIAVPPFITTLAGDEFATGLGVILAEAVIVDMQQLGMPVGEYVYINSSEEDITDFIGYVSVLEENPSFGYVLKGMVQQNRRGASLSVKVINIETKAVIASAVKNLPDYILPKAEKVEDEAVE